MRLDESEPVQFQLLTVSGIEHGVQIMSANLKLRGFGRCCEHPLLASAGVSGDDDRTRNVFAQQFEVKSRAGCAAHARNDRARAGRLAYGQLKVQPLAGMRVTDEFAGTCAGIAIHVDAAAPRTVSAVARILVVERDFRRTLAEVFGFDVLDTTC